MLVYNHMSSRPSPYNLLTSRPIVPPLCNLYDGMGRHNLIERLFRDDVRLFFISYFSRDILSG